MEQKINKRLIAHINDGYLQRLYLQKGADTYWLKMIIIAIGAIYGASHFVSFAM